MTARTYVSWVRPIAALLSEDRRRVIDFARSLPADMWNEPTEIKGWTRRDTLAHVAGGNDQLVQTVLRSVATHEVLDDAALRPDTDAENASGVAERRNWPIADLIRELESDGDEVQNLLSKLTEKDEDQYFGALSMTLGQFLRVVEHERHDIEHLGQLNPRDDTA